MDLNLNQWLIDHVWGILVSNGIYIVLHICPGLWHDKFHVEHSWASQVKTYNSIRSNQDTRHPTKIQTPNGGFLKWWYPRIIHFIRVFHYKPSMLWPIFGIAPTVSWDVGYSDSASVLVIRAYIGWELHQLISSKLKWRCQLIDEEVSNLPQTSENVCFSLFFF